MHPKQENFPCNMPSPPTPATSINLRPAPMLGFQDQAGEDARRWQAGVWWRDRRQASLATLAGEGPRGCGNSSSRLRALGAERGQWPHSKTQRGARPCVRARACMRV